LGGAALVVLACAGVFGFWLYRVSQFEKQHVTLIELRTIAQSCHEFAGDNGGYPVQERLGPLEGIQGDLVPEYQPYGLPTGRWKSPHLYLSRDTREVHPEGGPPRAVAEHFLVIATGNDRRLDPETVRLLAPEPDGEASIWAMPLRKTSRFQDDCILVDGEFRQLPGHEAERMGLGGPASAAR